jgi:hypothetical protein
LALENRYILAIREQDVILTEDGRVCLYSWAEEYQTLYRQSDALLANIKRARRNVFVFDRNLFVIVEGNDGFEKAEQLDVDGLKEEISHSTAWMKQKIIMSGEEKALRELEELARKKSVNVSAEEIRQKLKGMFTPSDITAYETPSVPIDAIRTCFKKKRYDFDKLEGVIHHPTVSLDYKIVSTHGYHLSIHRWVQCGAEVEKILRNFNDIEAVTREGLEEAKRTAFELFEEFPFENASARAGVYAEMLTLLCRPMIRGHVPIAVIQSAAQNSGKTLLAQTIIAAVTGMQARITTANFKNEEEMEKKLFAELMSLPEYIILDELNPKMEVRSQAIQTMVTSGTFTGRVLGRSENRNIFADLPIIMTGNNPHFSTDLSNRVFPINLVQTQADMSDRSFRVKNPEIEALKRHPQIVKALLTMFKWWATEGEYREGTQKFGKFDDWAAVIGGILESCGVEGFLADRRKFIAESDVGMQNLLSFVLMWWDKYKNLDKHTGDLKDIGAEAEIIDLNKGDRSAVIKLGYLLRANKNRKVQDAEGNVYTITGGKPDKGRGTWKLEKSGI